jgi:hypothetical protein
MGIADSQWILNDTVEQAEFTVHLNGYAGGYPFTELRWYYYTGSQNWAFQARSSTYGTTTLASYDRNTGTYKATSAGRSIYISDGDDLFNEEFAAWISANATPTDGIIYKVLASELVKTADAIRQKRGTEAEIEFANRNGFYDAIRNIYVGNDTRNATAFPSDIVSGQTAYAGESQITGIMRDANGVSF